MIRLGSIVLFALLVSACSGIEQKPFTPTARIDSVALLEVPEFHDFMIENMSATLIGMYATKTTYQDKLRHAINSTGFDFQKEFTTELRDALTDIGVRVETVPTERSKVDLLDSYDKLETNSQAILDVAPLMTVSFSTETPSGRTDYRPTMARLKVVLIESSSKEILYSESFKYGSKNSFISGTEIDPPENTYFETAEELVAGDNAVRSLRVALKHASQLIAERIKLGNDRVVQ